jgi:hypothetical protein
VNSFDVAETAAEQAERWIADVRDDPVRRMRFAFDTYTFRRGSQRYRPYGCAVVAFMRWQQARGVLNPPNDDAPGSPWWRAVNEDLLRDTCEARLLVQRGAGEASRPCVERWISFFEAPSARTWYLAHNASIVAGYLAHRNLATHEALAERFFMNVTLLRVLYAHALVADGDLALGRLSFISRLIGHPRVRTPAAFLAMKRILPASYPIEVPAIEELIARENRLGQVLDYGVIRPRIEALYAFSAQSLDEPRLLGLIRDGAPVYAWPHEKRHVWESPPTRRMRSFIGFLGIVCTPRRSATYRLRARTDR